MAEDSHHFVFFIKTQQLYQISELLSEKNKEINKLMTDFK